MDTRFHCVYLLTSLDPQCEGDYYVGYTVNPLRRLRQHNGELVNGARRTGRRGRPWTIVCCVSGFTEDRAALKFEWCWQNPTVSVRLKHIVGVLKGLRRLPYAVGILHLLVRAPLFNQLDLTLHIFEPELLGEARAKAEIFLATRHKPATRCPVASPGEEGEEDALTQRQGIAATSAYGSQAAPLSPLLPPLEPSALFHVEVTTRQAFEDRHLSHDRCLLLPSGGTCGAVGTSFTSERENDDSCLSASCPYDVSALSQAARAEWSNASVSRMDEDSDGEAVTQRCDAPLSPSQSRSWSPQHRDGTPDMILGYRSEEQPSSGVGASCSPADSRAASRPPQSALSSRSPTPPLSPGLLGLRGAPTAAATPPTDPGCPRIPLRFAHYRESDYAAAHAEEQHRLHHGLLPCSLCTLPLRPPCVLRCTRAPFCELRCHLSCLAMWMLYAEEERRVAMEGEGQSVAGRRGNTKDTTVGGEVEGGGGADSTGLPFRRLIPSQPCPCPLCGVELQWGVLVKELKRRVVVEGRVQAAQRRHRIEQRWQARLAQINGNRLQQESKGRRGKRERRGDVSANSTAAAAATPHSTLMGTAGVVAGTPSQRSGGEAAVRGLAAGGARGGATPELGEVSALSAGTTADTSVLSWTAFCEEDWLV